MRLLTLKLLSIDNQIKLKYETIKSVTSSIVHNNGPYKIPFHDVLGFNEDGYKFYFKCKTDPLEQIYKVRSKLLSFSDDPVENLTILYHLSNRILKLKECDLVHLFKQEAKDFFNLKHVDDSGQFTHEDLYAGTFVKEVHESERSMLDYMNTHLTINEPINDWLLLKLCRFNSRFLYLKAIHLLKHDLPIQTKSAILNEVITTLNKINDPSMLQRFFDKLTEYAKEELIKSLIGKKAHDGGLYNWRYTEIRVLESALFKQLDNGKISFDLNTNNAYHHYYKKLKTFDLKEELLYLFNFLNLELSPETDFDGLVIFTKESSQQLLNQFIVFDINNHSKRSLLQLDSYPSASWVTLFKHGRDNNIVNNDERQLNLANRLR